MAEVEDSRVEEMIVSQVERGVLRVKALRKKETPENSEGSSEEEQPPKKRP